MILLMPKATAVWLIENTSLTFSQIAEFCNLHIIEVQAIADGEVASLIGFDPIANGQLDLAEIERCEKDEDAKLQLKVALTADMILGKKKKRYVALSKRQDRPDAIAWFVRYYPHISDAKICELLATTKATVQSIRLKTHKNSANIKPKNPVHLGICSQSEIDALLVTNPSMIGDAPAVMEE
ncbi:MAG: DUF1013 domain-containing protein [Proteobacteria bacterium]|nr:DUF1013 domain-containing protein [Pseudomonadota bacterium]